MLFIIYYNMTSKVLNVKMTWTCKSGMDFIVPFNNERHI